MKLSRRIFLRSAGMAGAGLALSDLVLKRIFSSTNVWATSTVVLRMRSGPGMDYERIDELPYATRVPVMGHNGATDLYETWLYIEYNGKLGWVAAWLCTIEGDLASVPVVDADGNGAAPPPEAPPESPPESPPSGTPEPEPEAPSPPTSPGYTEHWDGSPMGRVLLDVMTIYAEPSWKAAYVDSLTYNDLVSVETAVVGEGAYPPNNTFLKIDRGYISSAWVQPVADNPNNPVNAVGEGGAWSVVTVPITWARVAPNDSAGGRHRVYYNEVQRVTGMENGYYHAVDLYGDSYWLKANYVRIIPPEEIGPLSAHVPPEEKRIEIVIHEQRLYAYEGDQLVKSVYVSTGMPDHPTPAGEYHIHDKRPGQRMTGGQTGGGYNLSGVPWICYFTSSWIALHGTYWHNDYGRRHSNGCVNLHPNDAKWLFRWTTPAPNYWDYKTLPNPEAGQPGTKVIVRWA